MLGMWIMSNNCSSQKMEHSANQLLYIKWGLVPTYLVPGSLIFHASEKNNHSVKRKMIMLSLELCTEDCIDEEIVMGKEMIVHRLISVKMRHTQRMTEWIFIQIAVNIIIFSGKREYKVPLVWSSAPKHLLIY